MATVTVNIHGVPISVTGAGEAGVRRGEQLTQLVRTLKRLPVQHLQQVPPITVGDRPDTNHGGGGGSAAPCPACPRGYIRINRRVFDPAIREVNRGRVNVTLLHEIGHVIDWAYQCVANAAAEDRQTLWFRGYDGHTHGPGEYFAVAYAQMYRDPATITPTRLAAMLRMNAFTPKGIAYR